MPQTARKDSLSTYTRVRPEAFAQVDPPLLVATEGIGMRKKFHRLGLLLVVAQLDGSHDFLEPGNHLGRIDVYVAVWIWESQVGVLSPGYAPLGRNRHPPLGIQGMSILPRKKGYGDILHSLSTF